MLLMLNISCVPPEIQRTGMEKYRGKTARDSRILCVQDTNLLFCTLNMMKIWWNLYIWFLNKFVMQVQGNIYRGTYKEHPFLSPF